MIIAARARNVVRKLKMPAALSIAYYAGAELAFLIGTLSDNFFAPFWPPNAVLFCALALSPYSKWPLYIAAVLPAHVFAELRVGMPWPQVWIAFVTNCMVAMLNAVSLRYVLGAPPWTDRLRAALIYVLVAAIASPAVCAFAGAFVRLGVSGETGNYWLFWQQWYVANALGSLTLAAVFLTSLTSLHEWSEVRTGKRQVEALVLVAGLLLSCMAALKANTLAAPSYFPAFLYLPLPFVIWAAVRFRSLGASVAIFGVTVISIWSLLQGPNVFVAGSVEENVLALQLFLSAFSGATLLLGAAADELQRSERATARLARHILTSQDDERRAVAKQLLDSVGQRLAVTTWALNRADRSNELEEALTKAIHELRELSYTLHPPLLDEAGLESALRARLVVISQCAGIPISLETAKLGRFPPNVELTVFRIIEDVLATFEGRADVKYDAAPRARPIQSRAGRIHVKLQCEALSDSDPITVTIETHGKGADGTGESSIAEGLALARVRERLRSVGGSLKIDLERGGTTIAVMIPRSFFLPC